MRKVFFTIGALLAAAFCFNSCTQEIDNPAGNAGFPFSICADASDTKTSIDGFSTDWEENDEINVFHALSGETSYVSDGKFVIEDPASKTFNGTVSSELASGKSYDWYALYPYASKYTSPDGTSSGFTYIGHSKGANQKGNNSTAHLCGTLCPLYGTATAVPSSAGVRISMHQIASVAEITVTNKTEAPLTVYGIELTSDEDIVGSYLIDMTGDVIGLKKSGDSYVKNTAVLNVSGATALAKGESAKFYIPIKPHTVESGNELMISVNGYEKRITADRNIVFNSGKIKKIAFDYAAEVSEETATVTFNFADPASLGLAEPANGDATNITAPIVKDDVTLTTTDGSTATRIWNTNGEFDLRVYKSGGSLTFAAPAGKVITSVVFTGGTVDTMTSNKGEFSSGKWTGKSGNVVFTATGTCRIATATLTIAAGEEGPLKPAIDAGNVTGVPARGGEQTLSYIIENPVATSTLKVECDGTVVTSAVTGENNTVKYSVSANTTNKARTGSISLIYGEVRKEISVAQLAAVFKLSREEVELDAAAGSNTTVTVTSDFDWKAEIVGDGFSVTPTSYTWASDGKATVKISALKANESADGVVTLGTVKFVSGGETITLTVNQKSSYVAPPVEGEQIVTLGPDWNALFKTNYTGSVSSVKAYSFSLNGVQDGLSIDVKNGNSTNAYLKTNDFRAYNGYEICLTAPAGKVITSIETEKGGKTFNSGAIMSDVGKTNISNSSLKWTGESNQVVLTITATVSFKTITVSFN